MSQGFFMWIATIIGYLCEIGFCFDLGWVSVNMSSWGSDMSLDMAVANN